MIKSEINKNVYIITIDRPRVNAIDAETLIALENKINEAENDKNSNTILITGEGSFFSFGLDIPSFLELNREDLKVSINRLLSICKTIYLSNKVTIAAINGHATGGGCMVAISTDFRFMVNQRAKIALNEINIGLSLFSSSISMLKNSIGLDKAKKFLLTGDLISSEAAKDMGLIHEIFHKEELFDKSMEFAHTFENKNALIIQNMKQELIQSNINELDDSDESIESFLDIFYLPETQKILKEIKIKK
tara:strand:- start:441 stop:1184 length:744 start_codon:yes stop_codon:yes gene_type:complete